MTFTHWVVYAANGGAALKQNVPSGGTFRICSSSKLTRLDAHYRATGANNLAVREVWKVAGQTRSTPGRLSSKGYFSVDSPQGLPEGKWSLKIVRKGTTLGSSSVTISPEHC